MARASEIEAATNRGHLPCLAQDYGIKQEILVRGEGFEPPTPAV